MSKKPTIPKMGSFIFLTHPSDKPWGLKGWTRKHRLITIDAGIKFNNKNEDNDDETCKS